MSRHVRWAWPVELLTSRPAVGRPPSGAARPAAASHRASVGLANSREGVWLCEELGWGGSANPCYLLHPLASYTLMPAHLDLKVTAHSTPRHILWRHRQFFSFLLKCHLALEQQLQHLAAERSVWGQQQQPFFVFPKHLVQEVLQQFPTHVDYSEVEAEKYNFAFENLWKFRSEFIISKPRFVGGWEI